LRERDHRGANDEEVLSVYRDLGVIPKADRDDNFNKTPQDLSNYKLVLPGDVVVNKMKAWQGSIAVSNHRGIVSGDYLVCEVVGRVDRQFLHHLLRSRPLIDEYGQRSTGIRPSQWRLYWEDLADIRVNLPSLEAQGVIAVYLDAETARIDTLISKKRRMVELLEERWSTVLDHLVWQWTTERQGTQLRHLLSVRISDGPHETPNFCEDGVPFLSVDNIVRSRLSFDGCRRISEKAHMLYASKACPQRHDVLVTKAASIGKAAIVDTDIDFNVWSPLAILRPNCQIILPKYLWYALRTARVQAAMLTSSTKSTQNNISMEDLGSLRIPMRPIHEQVDVVSELERRETRVVDALDSLDTQITLLQERRQTLITAVVTGEVDVPGVAI
jgi:type I restriction enzyme S subunit